MVIDVIERAITTKDPMKMVTNGTPHPKVIMKALSVPVRQVELAVVKSGQKSLPRHSLYIDCIP